jgi:opacity protein-like surface antigen
MTVKRTLLLAATLVAALMIPAAATAVVPPKNCSTVTVGGKRYQVKADQISCATARDHARRYLRTGGKPRGYTCKKPSRAKGRVNFYCNNGRKIYFGIRR